MRRRVLGAVIAFGVAGSALLFVSRRVRAPAVATTIPAEPAAVLRATPPPLPPPAPLEGLDLTRIAIGDDGVTAPAGDHRVARLTLDPMLERAAMRLMAAHHLPEAAMVVVDVATGRLLAYASHLEHAPRRDLCAEATAPAASVFKIVTGAALVEDAGLSPDVRQCYSGGEHQILASDLEDDPARDKWCTTLAGAMGHSTNAVFAKLALRHLSRDQLDTMARHFGFDEPIPFDVPIQPSTLHLPEGDLAFARTAAGFWNSTLSPLEAAWISATVARGGEAPRLSIVDQILDDKGGTVWTAPDPAAARRVVARETAQALTRMMEVTVAEGTSYRAFHDGRGASFLPNVPVAGKTGTLTDAGTHGAKLDEPRFYTWFTGFAPSRPSDAGVPHVPQVAVAVLVVNRPTWTIKANVLAREILREYFAREHTPGVTAPTQRLDTSAIARRD